VPSGISDLAGSFDEKDQDEKDMEEQNTFFSPV
jgi:hypothetical protein